MTFKGKPPDRNLLVTLTISKMKTTKVSLVICTVLMLWRCFYI